MGLAKMRCRFTTEQREGQPGSGPNDVAVVVARHGTFCTDQFPVELQRAVRVTDGERDVIEGRHGVMMTANGSSGDEFAWLPTSYQWQQREESDNGRTRRALGDHRPRLRQAREVLRQLVRLEFDTDNPVSYGVVPREDNLNAEGIGIGGGLMGMEGHPEMQ